MPQVLDLDGIGTRAKIPNLEIPVQISNRPIFNFLYPDIGSRD